MILTKRPSVNLECVILLNPWTFNWTRSPRIFQNERKSFKLSYELWVLQFRH